MDAVGVTHTSRRRPRRPIAATMLPAPREKTVTGSLVYGTPRVEITRSCPATTPSTAAASNASAPATRKCGSSIGNASGRRVTAVTACPSASARRVTSLPVGPFAPNTTSFTRFLLNRSR